MEKIYNRYEDSYVACTIVYADAFDTKLYADKQRTVPIKKEQLANLFCKGVIVHTDIDGMMRPMSFDGVSMHCYNSEGRHESFEAAE